MKKQEPIGHVLGNEFYGTPKEFFEKRKLKDNEMELEPVFSKKQIIDLAQHLKSKVEVPLRHTKVVDWDEIADAFSKFGITL